MLLYDMGYECVFLIRNTKCPYQDGIAAKMQVPLNTDIGVPMRHDSKWSWFAGDSIFLYHAMGSRKLDLYLWVRKLIG